jgi:diguanylate cyclase (GGDEF)-like protein/PAS domain S-box-containing protein
MTTQCFILMPRTSGAMQPDCPPPVPIDRLATYQLTRESVFIRIALPFILSQNTPATTLIDGDQRVRNDIRAVLLRKGVLHVNLHYDARGVLLRPWQPATEHWRQTLVETIPAITYVHRILPGVTAAIVYVSPQVETLLGRKPEDYVAHPEHWLALVHPDDQERVRDAMSLAVATHEPFSAEYRVVASDGRTVWLRDAAVMVEDPTDGAQLWQGVQFDITAEKAAETQLQHLAFYDSLTGLPNRRLCIDRLESLLSRPRRPEVALLFLDLDRFKVINDGIGHAAGDELLVAVAQRLTPHVAGRGSLARFGGDEFVAVLEGFAHPREVEQVAEKLLSALRRPFSAKGYDLVVGGTIGVAIASPELGTPKDLLRAADVALYRAKAAGGGVFAVFNPDVDRQGLERLEQEADLRRALEQGEFRIAYQPIVDIASRYILAVEALLRWDHPERGLLPPSEFIPLADETGLIVPLGRWVIEEACRQVSHWQDVYPAARSLQVSVNLSARQFRQDDLENDVAAALGKSGLAPGSLAFELKEGDAQANSADIAATLDELKRLGVKVTIDDFGKGWAALGSLTRFRVDDLKIDGSCVSRLGQDQHDIDIVRALVGMAKAIGVDVTAGSVETSEQLAVLRELGCDRAQGRHLAPPLTVDEVERLLQLQEKSALGVKLNPDERDDRAS